MATKSGPTIGSGRQSAEDLAVRPHLRGNELLGWFARHGRDLPWRRTRDPWAVVVAELMLQQTQVARVIERWARFLARFPTVAACAAAPVGDVIDEWSGLGYNRRAVFLHRMACEVDANHGGVFPTDLKELMALPGIGPYTGRAIRAFAFELPAAVLDTNVARIMARTSGRTLSQRQAQDLADANMAPDSWSWNQALLDVGARLCTARSPDCESCPLRRQCSWELTGRPQPDPAVGSAGVSGRQSRFEGSDRQGRGRLVAAARSGPVSAAALPAVMGWPTDPERAEQVAATLVADGLIRRNADGYWLA